MNTRLGWMPLAEDRPVKSYECNQHLEAAEVPGGVLIRYVDDGVRVPNVALVFVPGVKLADSDFDVDGGPGYCLEAL